MKKTTCMLAVITSIVMMLGQSGCTKEMIQQLQPLTSSVTDSVTTVIEQVTTTKIPISVTNPGTGNDIRPNIETALNNAKDGDIIELPQGSYPFSGTIVTSKLVSIKGKGKTLTTLYRPDNIADADLKEVPMIYFKTNRDTSSGIVVSGIYFKGKSASGSVAEDIGVKITNCLDFVITGCKFENFGYAAVEVWHKDNLAGGLIFKNEFYHNYKGDGLGAGYGVEIGGENKQWVNSPMFGSSNFIFIEDNTFEYHRHAIAADGGALYVCRYNTILNNLINHAINTHPAQLKAGENYYSTRAVEIYNNTVQNKKFINGSEIVAGQDPNLLYDEAIFIKGGEAVVFNNTISGYQSGVAVGAYQSDVKESYPISYQIGWASGKSLGSSHTGTSASQGNGDVFIWNNNFTPYAPLGQSRVTYNYNTSYLAVDRDYHLSEKPGYLPYQYPHPLASTVK